MKKNLKQGKYVVFDSTIIKLPLLIWSVLKRLHSLMVKTWDYIRILTNETPKNAGLNTVRGKFHDCGTFTLSRLRYINRTYQYTSFGES